MHDVYAGSRSSDLGTADFDKYPEAAAQVMLPVAGEVIVMTEEGVKRQEAAAVAVVTVALMQQDGLSFVALV